MLPRVLCFVAACAILAAAILSWNRTPSAGEREAARPNVSAAPLPDRPPPAALRDPRQVMEPEEEGAARTEVARPSTATPLPAGDTPPELIVRGQVQCAGLDPSGAQVTLWSKVGRLEHFHKAFATALGTYEIDFTSLMSNAARMGLPQEFRMTVTHPQSEGVQRSFRLGRGPLPLARSQDRTRNQLEFEMRSGRNVYVVDFELRPCAIVRGTLVGGGPEPREVMVCAARPEEDPASGWIQSCVPDERGKFELRLVEGASYAIVAVARTYRPATQWIHLPVAGSYGMAMSLDRGHSISGRLSLGNEGEAGGTSLDLLAPVMAAGRPLAVWSEPAPSFGGLIWLDGAFEWRTRTTRTRGDGTFEFRGLAPVEYDLRAMGLGMSGVEIRGFAAGSVRAPAAGLELGPLLSSLSLHLGPTPKGPVRFRLVGDTSAAGTFGPYETNAQGLARLLLPPLATFEVEVDGARIGSVTCAQAGEHRIWALAR
jgi:hypothetical protein